MNEDPFEEETVHHVDDTVTREVTEPPEGIPWGALILLIWAILLIIFSVQNADQTTVQFLGWSVEMPVALLVMITALATLVLTGVGLAFYRRRRRRNRELRARARASER